MLVKLDPEQAVLSYSEALTLVDIEPLDAPHCPVEVDHAHEFEHIHFHIGVVAGVVLGDGRDFLEG